MKLRALADVLFKVRLEGDGEIQISGIEMDSRKVKPGDLFVCIRGKRFDGHQYAEEALQNGAAALLVQERLPVDAPQLIHEDTRYAMAAIASHFYGFPSSRLKLIGITGTNGKTTTASLIEQILVSQNKKAGLMGTIQMKIGNDIYAVNNTTQEAHILQRSFRQMIDSGAEYCVMEVSSHALEFGRVIGCDFRTAVFTNLSQDHLDFHGTMENYLAAKGLLFSRLGNAFDADRGRQKYAVLNADDPASRELSKLTAAQIITYGIDEPADVRAGEIALTAEGTVFRLTAFGESAEVKMKLLGKFNIYNALAAAAAALAEGISLADAASALSEASPVEGRMEMIEAGQPFLVIVDYAHTPDGLEKVLRTVREFAEGNICCMFGCGGDRDRGKRPVMGKIAAELSDHVIVTTDNPRNEDPAAIMNDIAEGIRQTGAGDEKLTLIEDRRAAIQKAIEWANPGDVVLIMGKGHETYQEMKGQRMFFDDRLEAKQAIRSIMH